MEFLYWGMDTASVIIIRPADALVCNKMNRVIRWKAETENLRPTFSRWYRADSRLAPSQWETSLRSNTVSHWLGANPESALWYEKGYRGVPVWKQYITADPIKLSSIHCNQPSLLTVSPFFPSWALSSLLIFNVIRKPGKKHKEIRY